MGSAQRNTAIESVTSHTLSRNMSHCYGIPRCRIAGLRLQLDIGAELIHGDETSLYRLVEEKGWEMEELISLAQGDGGPLRADSNDGFGLFYLGGEKRMLAMDSKVSVAISSCREQHANYMQRTNTPSCTARTLTCIVPEGNRRPKPRVRSG